MLFQLREETTCFGVDKQTEYLMFVFVNANAQLLLKWATKNSPLLQIVLLLPLKFVYIHRLLVSRPIVLKSLYLTKRNAVWESLVICRACHHEGFLKFGDSTSALASRQLKSERNARQVSKAYTILQRKDIWVIRFWKLDIFFSFLIFSFFLFIGQTTRGQRKCRFYRFFSARSDFNNRARGIIFYYRLQGVFSQFTNKIWKFYLKYFSYQCDQRRPSFSTLICISKTN